MAKSKKQSDKEMSDLFVEKKEDAVVKPVEEKKSILFSLNKTKDKSWEILEMEYTPLTGKVSLKDVLRTEKNFEVAMMRLEEANRRLANGLSIETMRK